ncbi:MAG: hypothetical protein F7C38_00735 [Desulfurococcales archaeon]|nr:hypothetical protein [Desulfurococcales archaeon]
MSHSLDEFTAAKAKKGPVIYKPIHILYTRPRSECNFFKYTEESGGYIAWCMVLNRPLTKDEAIKCEKYWKTCPYRRIGLQMEEDSMEG